MVGSYDCWRIGLFPMAPGTLACILWILDVWLVGFLWLLDCWLVSYDSWNASCFPMTPGWLDCFLWLLVGLFPMTPGWIVSYDSFQWCLHTKFQISIDELTDEMLLYIPNNFTINVQCGAICVNDEIENLFLPFMAYKSAKRINLSHSLAFWLVCNNLLS